MIDSAIKILLTWPVKHEKALSKQILPIANMVLRQLNAHHSVTSVSEIETTISDTRAKGMIPMFEQC